ncbi:MAG: tetratricopeptide repeat protein, partial [Myxococcales bacterium]|nr:tetratricopeptide repeat protein [Myxococcales bacterium]
HARAGLGRALIRAGSYQEAEQALSQAIEMVPNDADSAAALAEVYASTDRVEEAYAQFRRAADLDPTNPGPLTSAARLAIQQQRPVLAVGFLQRVLGTHPNHAPALALMGDVMRGRRQNDQARDYYQRALRGTGELDRAAVQQSLQSLGGG